MKTKIAVRARHADMTELACMKNKASRENVTHVEKPIKLLMSDSSQSSLLGLASPGCYGPSYK